MPKKKQKETRTVIVTIDGVEFKEVWEKDKNGVWRLLRRVKLKEKKA